MAAEGVARDASEGAVQSGWFGAAVPVPPGASAETTPAEPPAASDEPRALDALAAPNDADAAAEASSCSVPDGAEWRGRGRIDPDCVRSAVVRQRDDLKACYSEFVLRRLPVTMSARVHFLVNRDGTVAQVDVCLSTDDPEFMRCIEDVFRRVRFPRPEGGPARVLFPVSFRL